MANLGGGAMVRERISTAVALVVALALLAGISARLGSPIPIAFAADSPDQALETAADKVEAATAKGGSGFAFTVVSRSTLHAREGGPLIEIPDPLDRYKSLGLADLYYVGGSIAEGIVSPAGYFLQMRAGPSTPDAPPDFEKSQPTLAALVRDGTTYRNDGEGWYETDQPPGIGLDLATIALLPTLLRDAGSPTAKGETEVDGANATKLEATSSIDDAPGLMAIDAASFTELSEPLSFAIDDLGRLVEIRGLMRNTRMETFDLLVEVVITLRYPDPLPALPPPEPIWTPPALPTEETP
jgi:hypothetical protein